MALTFQGGQALPAQGTTAYNAAAAAPSGPGSYNASTGIISSGNSVIYSPNSNASVPQIPSSITGANTAPAQSIPIPQATPQQNLTGTIVGNNAGLGGNGVIYNPQTGLLNYQDPASQVLDQNKNDFASLLSNLKTPVKTADIYNQEYANSGIAEKQQSVLNYTNQINAITAKAQADQLSLVGQGRGVPEVIIGGQQAQVAKEAAIQVLPIQAQLAAAQGNLKLAQDHLDTVFQLKAQDAQAENDFYNKQIELAYNFFDKQGQQKLSIIQNNSDKNFGLLTNSISFAQSLATKALESGQAPLAAQITSAFTTNLPSQNSPTFSIDLQRFQNTIAGFESQIKPASQYGFTTVTNPLTGASEVIATNARTGSATPVYGAQPSGTNGSNSPYATTFAPEVGKKPIGKPDPVAAGYATRATTSNDIINQLGGQFTSVGSIPGNYAPQFMKSSDRLQYEQAQRNFANAILRRESGAAINQDEFTNARLQYFPQPGDTSAVVAQKEQNRVQSTNALISSAGTAYTGTYLSPSSQTNGQTVQVAGKTFPVGQLLQDANGNRGMFDASGNWKPQ